MKKFTEDLERKEKKDFLCADYHIILEKKCQDQFTNPFPAIATHFHVW